MAREAGSQDWKTTLDSLAARRAPYRSCLSGIAQGVVDDFVRPGGATVELGAGLGQLCEWLGEERTATWTLTDPDVELVEHLAATHSARAVDATSMDLDSSSVDAMVSLCVLDVVDNLPRVAREIERVLRPGGTFIHLLDMTTALPLPLEDVAGGGLVAIPNIFFDLSDATWPEDLVLLEGAPLKKLRRHLRDLDHPLERTFGDYFELYRKQPFVVQPAALALRDLVGDPAARELLTESCAHADRLAAENGWPRLKGTPVSTTRHLQQRMEAAFTTAEMNVQVSDLALTWDTVPTGSEERFNYRSLCVGHERTVAEGLPKRTLSPDAPRPPMGTTLVEAGVFVFAARKPC